MALYDFQRHDVNKLWWRKWNGRGMFVWKVGTGKTYTASRVVKSLLDNRKVSTVVVCCPPALIRDWIDNAKDAGVEAVEYSSRKKKLGQVTITSYDLLKRVPVSEDTLLIADECHKIKNSTSARGRNFRKKAQTARYLLMLTGTPSQRRDPEEMLNYLWSVNRFDIPHNITRYRNKYSVWRGSGMIKFPVSTRAGRVLIDSCMKQCTVFRDMSDVGIQLPTYNEYTVKTGKGLDMVKIAKQLLADANIDSELEEGEDRPHIAHALQAANGINPITGQLENTDKINTILEYLESFGSEKVIVWVYWRAFAKALHEATRKESVLVYGGMSDQVKTDNIKAFSNDKRILIASLGSVSEGFNLQFCHNSIIANQWYDIVKDEQSRGRIERIGQTERMTAIRLVAKGTLEESVVQVLKQKMNLQGAKAFLNGVLNKRYGL